MVVRGKEFDDIYDLVGIRVIVPSVKDCYAALGSIHASWKPIQGRFKDYIAMPKFNLYQSLHTTVIGPEGKPLEVQIRTAEMHGRAEYGIAAHWSYKDGSPRRGHRLAATDASTGSHETSDPGEFMANLKVDLEQDEVFVFTPKGDVVTLPAGATPVDFAYAIHTEVGHTCIGARVNGRLVPLDAKLASGDAVEVFTSKVEGAGPSRDWLKFVATQRAKSKIRHWYSRERREDAIDSGRDDLMKALRREGLPVQKVSSSEVLLEAAKSLNHKDVDALYASIGENHVSAKSVASRIKRLLGDGGPDRDQIPTTVRRPRRHNRRRGPSVHVEGLDDVMVRLSKCCTPVPGDEIMGFVTRGRGVSVHRNDCANAVALGQEEGDRLIDVDWDTDSDAEVVASRRVKALDRGRLLQDVIGVFADHHANIISSTTNTGADRVAKLRFEFELSDPSQLDAMVSAIKGIDSVYDAYRVLAGGGR
ncbi:MAG: TGS domain-containing protein [Acidimicrobiia bacterium]|nr:TGS domain-containing protein [Acidimicrobiia bacterium]